MHNIFSFRSKALPHIDLNQHILGNEWAVQRFTKTGIMYKTRILFMQFKFYIYELCWNVQLSMSYSCTDMYRNLAHAICVVLLLVSVKRYIFSYIYKILMIYCVLMSFIIQWYTVPRNTWSFYKLSITTLKVFQRTNFTWLMAKVRYLLCHLTSTFCCEG